MTRYAFKTLLIILTGASIGWLSIETQAEEHHHHGAHVHGVAHLNVALEGQNLYMEFVSPAANIVGFEYRPKTQAERDAVVSARNTLMNAETVFKLSPAAGARLVEASVVSEAEHDTHHDAEHHHGGEDHHASEHGHEGEDHHASEHGHEGEGHHDETAGKDHDHHDTNDHEGETHSDFRAVYRFVCQNPDKLADIEVRLFDLFAGIETIAVRILTETKQTAMELTAKKPKIQL